MKKINTYIIEKLRINKNSDIIIKNEPEFYFNCDIDEITKGEITSKEVDKKLNSFSNDSWFGPMERKNHRGNTRNKFWYAIYCYLYDNGPSKKTDIVKYLKPDAGSDYNRLFSQMNKKKIFSHGIKDKRGFLYPNPPEKWLNNK